MGILITLLLIWWLFRIIFEILMPEIWDLVFEIVPNAYKKIKRLVKNKWGK